MNVQESYRILRLQPGAGLDEVKSAFRRLAFELHPDLHPENPHSVRHFQRVNEAYVLLKTQLESEPGSASNGPSGAARSGDEASRGSGESSRPPSGESSRSGKRRTAEKPRAKAKAAAQETQAPPEELLKDILKDPFARQVFEDIYREIRKSGGKGPVPALRPKKKMRVDWGDKRYEIDLTQGLVAGVKGWFRGLMDENQDVYLPPFNLRPGARLRLQVTQGWSGKIISVEVTLPPDFVIGRPIRLKGLGKRMGPLKGDLFLRIFAA